YTQSYIIVKYLIDTYGSDKMAELLNTVKSGNRIDTALEIVYGFDTSELDAEWRGTTGFAATPTLEVDALDETPTAVPTLALANPLESLPTSTPTPVPPTPVPATATSEPTATANPTETPAPTQTEIAMVATTVIEIEAGENSQVEPTPDSNNTIWFVIAAVVLGLFGSLITFLRTRRS
ncbi:MAG: peptidase MA family metallohydrolase, partial [Chloroflexota bacterium]